MGSQKMKLALLTSGGDAPGMNAAIRAVVRMGIARGFEVVGIQAGYNGLLAEQFQIMGPRDVSNIIQRGGTILKTSRSPEFNTAAGVRKAAAILERHQIQGLVIIGGDGSFRGGEDLAKVWKGQIIGVPGTIDNDLFGTDFTIGFDTAVETALEAIDKIRDTAESHERFFLVEVMGRHSGFIALSVAIASGAEEVILPERKSDIRAICKRLCEGERRGKTSSIIVVAEGCDGGAIHVAEELKRLSRHQYRVAILGYLQRGGAPATGDRILASKLGAYAVEMFAEGKSRVMVGEVGGKLVCTPLRDTFRKKKRLNPDLLRIHKPLSA